MEDKWGNEPDGIMHDWFYISNNEFKDESENLAYELYKLDIYSEMDLVEDILEGEQGKLIWGLPQLD